MTPLSLLVLTLSAAPSVGLWQRETSQAPRSAVDSVVVVLRDSLAAQGFPAGGEPGRCGPVEDCLVKKARDAGGIAIGLSIAAGRKGLLVDLEAVAPDGDVLASVTFPLPAQGDRALPEVKAFVETLATRWRARVPPVARVEPREPVLTPEAPVLEEEPAPASFWSTPGARVTLIGAGASAVGSIALGIAGGLVKGQLDASLAASPPVLTRPQALEQAGTANGLLTGSLITGALTAAAALVLVILWAVFEP